jgi:hypothetical protein
MGITMQVLDGTYGQSAAGVHAYLERASGGGWVTVCDVETDSKGRVEDRDSGQLERGIYRVVFDSDRYFGMLGAITLIRRSSSSSACPAGHAPSRSRSRSRPIRTRHISAPWKAPRTARAAAGGARPVPAGSDESR